ncbi:MAG: sensor histidine kinase [Clostridiales bacterium]|jgi:signal transduction histidine kinase|nr:sensor histidine kinase [Clostridiales bacterium]
MKRFLSTLEIAFYALFAAVFIGLLFYFLGIQPMSGGANQLNIWICICLVCGGMLMMALYNLSLRFFTRREKAALYFAIFCLGQSLRFLFMPGSIGWQLFPSLPELFATIWLRQIPYTIALIGLILFVYEIFGAGRSKKIKYALIIVSAAVNVAIILMGLDTVWRAILGLPLVAVYAAICIGVILKSGEYRQNRLSVLYLFGFILYIFSGFFTTTSYNAAPYIAVAFNFVFAIIHSILLSDRFAKALKGVEEANLVLEDKVAERTAKLQETATDLAASERSVREAVANISHDLKTPISVLSANLEIALEADIPADVKRHLNIAYNKSSDLARLIRELLSVGNMETAKYDMTWISLSTLLSGIAAKYTEQMEAAGIVLNVSYRQDCQVWQAENQIIRVFDNILSNAQRYTAKDGSISISAGEIKDGFVPIFITDTGCGIAQEHLPHIFEQYYKADKSRGAEGAGLGLYIVKTAVEAMGGSVVAESKLGEWTKITFSVTAQAPTCQPDLIRNPLIGE